MNICVYCSASKNIPLHYKQKAECLGRWIAQNDHTLVYGGATGGLMTSVSEGASACKGEIIGVIPQRIISAGRESGLVTEQHLVATMNERKALLKELADVFVVLPGSYGSLDEMFDVVASGTVGEHRKLLILVNENNFYDYLLLQIQRMKDEGFIPAQENYQCVVVDNVDLCIAHLERLNV